MESVVRVEVQTCCTRLLTLAASWVSGFETDEVGVGCSGGFLDNMGDRGLRDKQDAEWDGSGGAEALHTVLKPGSNLGDPSPHAHTPIPFRPCHCGGQAQGHYNPPPVHKPC